MSALHEVSMLGLLAILAALGCDAAYPSDELLLDVGDLEVAISADDRAGAGALARVMEGRLVCLSEQASMLILGRVYRAIGGGLALDEPTRARGIAWLDTAYEIDPSFTYSPEDLPVGSPLWEIDAVVHLRPPPPLVWRDVSPEPNTRLWLDGKLLRRIGATPGRPHLLQRTSDDAPLSIWLIEGDAFPDLPFVALTPEILRLEARTARRRAKSGPWVNENHPFWFYNTLPVELMAGGVAVAATGGVALVAAGHARAKFDLAEDVGALEQYRASANRLTTLGVGLIVLGAGGVGLGAVYFVDADGGFVMGPALRVRW